MPKTIETTQPTITLSFTLEEARYIMPVVERQAEETGNFLVANMLNGLREFVKQNERGV